MVTSGIRACGAAPFQHLCPVLLACPSRASPLPLIDRTSARPAGNLRITTIFRRACKGGYGRNWEAIAARFQVGEFADIFAHRANAISGFELALILESLEICNHALDSNVADHEAAELVFEVADKPALALHHAFATLDLLFGKPFIGP